MFMNKMELYTGMKQLEKWQNKPEMLRELIEECSKAALNFPLKQDITEKVLFDAMQTDQDFIGLNVKWVRKVLNLYCQVHGVTKENQREEVVDLRKSYQDMINFWDERKDLDPNGERKDFATANYVRVSNGDAPVDDLEGIKIMGKMFEKQIAGTFIETVDNPVGSGTRLKENIKRSTGHEIYRYDDGFEVYAKSQQEADEIHNSIGK